MTNTYQYYHKNKRVSFISNLPWLTVAVIATKVTVTKLVGELGLQRTIGCKADGATGV